MNLGQECVTTQNCCFYPPMSVRDRTSDLVDIGTRVMLVYFRNERDEETGLLVARVIDGPLAGYIHWANESYLRRISPLELLAEVSE